MIAALLAAVASIAAVDAQQAFASGSPGGCSGYADGSRVSARPGSGHGYEPVPHRRVTPRSA